MVIQLEQETVAYIKYPANYCGSVWFGVYARDYQLPRSTYSLLFFMKRILILGADNVVFNYLDGAYRNIFSLRKFIRVYVYDIFIIKIYINMKYILYI